MGRDCLHECNFYVFYQFVFYACMLYEYVHAGLDVKCLEQFFVVGFALYKYPYYYYYNNNYYNYYYDYYY